MILPDWKRWARALVVPVVVLVGMELLVRGNALDASHAARPSVVVGKIPGLLFEESLGRHVMISVLRLFGGVGAGVLLGTASGMLVAQNRVLDRYLSPSVRFVAGIPIVLWMPLCVMFFGVEEGFKWALLTISSGLLLHMATFQAVRDTDRVYFELGLLYEKTWWQRVRHLLLPAASGSIVMGARTALTFGWVVLFFLEYAVARQGVEGLGWFVANERQLGRVEQEYAGLMVLGVLAFGIDVLVGALGARWTRWSDRFGDHAAGRA